jgi:lipopolysaccharide export LptBFGC system permease protein LptF
MPRPPTTLLLHTFADLAKLLALSAGVLVLIIAMGAAIKPLSDGLLEAQDAAVYISLALVPMLAYVLPFAAGFASTLVYHRLGTSNEATAAYAGGVSHKMVLLPALVMGLTLGISLGALSESVIPRFLREMRHLITVDFARLLSGEIGRGKALRLDDWLILADRAEQIDPAPGSGVREQVVFSNFAAIKLAKDGTPEQEVAASQATMWLYPPGSFPAGVDETAATDEDASFVVLELRGVSASDATSVGGFRDSSTAVFTVPNVFRDNPKYLPYRELRALRDDPDRMNDVDSRRRDLALALERQSVNALLRTSLAKGELILRDESGRSVRVLASMGTADGASGRAELLPRGGDSAIQVFHQREGDRGPVALHSIAPKGELRVANVQRGDRRAIGIALELQQVRSREESTQATFTGVPERSLLRIAGLHADDPAVETLFATRSYDLLARVDAAPDASTQAALDRAASLRKKIDEVLREALSKQHERWAMAASCLVIMLTGAITALLLSQRMPLTTYLWTFIPGLVSWVTISGGQQLTEQAGTRGLLMMWSGVGLLGVYAGVMYWRLARR